MVTPSSVLAWRIPWTEEPEGPQSMGLQKVRHMLTTESACMYHVLDARKNKSNYLFLKSL